MRVPGQDGRRADAFVENAAEGKRHGYVAVFKRVDRFATLGIIKHQVKRYDEPGLLVAPHITPEVAERCRELHIPFIDTAGNVYLQKPGLLVFVKGQRARLENPYSQKTQTHHFRSVYGLTVARSSSCNPPRYSPYSLPLRDHERLW